MSYSQSYRDNYEGRGAYAKENDAMLDSECSRTTVWQNESAQYKCSVNWMTCLGGAIVAAAATTVIWLLALGSRG
jgi:hypothetical protein